MEGKEEFFMSLSLATVIFILCMLSAGIAASEANAVAAATSEKSAVGEQSKAKNIETATFAMG
jgi:hypothetical protein